MLIFFFFFIDEIVEREISSQKLHKNVVGKPKLYLDTLKSYRNRNRTHIIVNLREMRLTKSAFFSKFRK